MCKISSDYYSFLLLMTKNNAPVFVSSASLFRFYLKEEIQLFFYYLFAVLHHHTQKSRQFFLLFIF